MSKNDRHIPYDVAYRQVTGCDPCEMTVEEMDVRDVLAHARDGQSFVLRFQGRGSYGHVIGCNDDPLTRVVVRGDGLSLLAEVTLYPVGGVRYVDGRVELGGDDSFPGMVFSVGGQNQRLMEYLVDENDHVDGVSVYVTQSVEQVHLRPVVFADSDDVMFVVVRQCLVPFSRVVDGEVLSGERVCFMVRFYLSPSRVRVLTTVSDSRQFMYYGGQQLSGGDYQELVRLTSGRNSDYSRFNADVRDMAVSSRRRSDRDDLRELVKMVNGGMDADEVDLVDHDQRVRQQVYGWW